MPAYTVVAPESAGRTLVGGANVQIIFAASAAIAKEVASAKFDSDGDLWTDATVTEIVADSDWEGWTFNIRVLGGFGVGGADSASESFVGTAADNTIDEVAAALVVLLNALAGIANASYDAGTNILTIASAADALGDQKVEVDIIPPDGKSSISGLVGTITDEGIEAAALTVQLPADAAVIPQSVLQASN